MEPISITLFSIAAALAGCTDVHSQLDATSSFLLQGDVWGPSDVSTISRGDGDMGVIASDEGAVVQVISFSADGREAHIITNHRLAEPESLEIDLEASAFMDGWFYVTGSHGLAKKKGTYQESRYRIYRFRLGNNSVLSNLQTAILDKIFTDDPILGKHYKKPLQQKGVNIEGLVARDKALFLGLRSPNLDGDAFVIRVDPEGVFTDENPSYDLLSLPLGTGLGIRAMTLFRDGFLIIAGNAGSETSKDFPATVDFIDGRSSKLVFWNPTTSEVVHLGALPRKGKGKEEAILTISEGGADVGAEILILYDSIRNGGGTIFRIPPFPSAL